MSHMHRCFVLALFRICSKAATREPHQEGGPIHFMISHIHRIFYAMFELELLATVWTIGKARPFSEGIHFEKRTNHITIDPKPEQLFAV